MGKVEPPLVRELRKIVVVQKRHIEELRGAVVALMEPDMPRILRTPGGIMVLDKKPPMNGGATGALSEDFTSSR